MEKPSHNLRRKFFLEGNQINKQKAHSSTLPPSLFFFPLLIKLLSNLLHDTTLGAGPPKMSKPRKALIEDQFLHLFGPQPNNASTYQRISKEYSPYKI